MKNHKDLVCPTCGNQKYCDLDMHSDGFAQDLFECNECECLWVVELKPIATIIKPGR